MCTLGGKGLDYSCQSVPFRTNVPLNKQLMDICRGPVPVDPHRKAAVFAGYRNSQMQPAALWWRLSAAGGHEARGASPSYMISVDLVNRHFFFCLYFQ